jgi:hypothetical protein
VPAVAVIGAVIGNGPLARHLGITEVRLGQLLRHHPELRVPIRPPKPTIWPPAAVQRVKDALDREAQEAGEGWKPSGRPKQAWNIHSLAERFGMSAYHTCRFLAEHRDITGHEPGKRRVLTQEAIDRLAPLVEEWKRKTAQEARERQVSGRGPKYSSRDRSLIPAVGETGWSPAVEDIKAFLADRKKKDDALRMQRKCLRCWRAFDSESPANRICDPCKNGEPTRRDPETA